LQRLLAGSLGVIEEFFGAELAADHSPGAGWATVITPAKIVGLPRDQCWALSDALRAHAKQVGQQVEGYRQALQRYPDGTHATMLIAREARPYFYSTLVQGRRLVAYFGRVLVDDPLPPGYMRAASGGSHPFLHRILAHLAWVRPLIAGGHMGFFPPELAERLSDTDPVIIKESARRWDEWVELKHRLNVVETSVILGKPGEAAVDASQFFAETFRDPVLNRLAASVGLGVDAMDTTGDTYVLRYLGEQLTAVPTRLASVQLPRLELLSPTELAVMLSSDEVLAEVRSALDNALRSVPEGLTHDPDLAARWVDDRLMGNLETAVQRLRISIRRLPDGAKIGGAATGVGATVLAGALTASPPLALGVGAVGAAADLTASWLHQWRRYSQKQPAIRVLTHLTSQPRRFRHTRFPVGARHLSNKVRPATPDSQDPAKDTDLIDPRGDQ